MFALNDTLLFKHVVREVVESSRIKFKLTYLLCYMCKELNFQSRGTFQ